MFGMLFLYRWITAQRSYVTISGKAFRPRPMDVGGLRWALFGACALYVLLSAVLPVAALVYASVQRLAVAFPAASNFTLDNFRQALSINAVRSAMANSLALGAVAATIGVVITGLLSWVILRTRLPGRGVLEYVVMFPQAVPRLVFAFGMMWAWLVFPIPIYGTFWVLLIAYLTVFLPLGVRTISGVVMQLDRSLDECGQVCGAGWGYRMKTITAPLLRPGLLAAWLLIFVASVRELGASILLMGPGVEGHDPGDRRGLVLRQLGTHRRDGADPDRRHRRDDDRVRPAHPPRRRPARGLTPMSEPRTGAAIEVENLSIRYGAVTAVESVSFAVDAGQQLTLLGPSGCGKTSTLRAVAGLERPTSGAIRVGGRTVYDGAAGVSVPTEQRGMSMVFQSYAIWPHMTVFENVAYGLRVRKESGAALGEKVRHALELVKMEAFAERNASQLSGGQQQRVALARACAFSPDRPAVRRAALQSRRQAARGDAHRAARAAAPARRHLALRDPRSRGGAGDVRPHRRDAAGLVEQSGTPPTSTTPAAAHAFVADFIRLSYLIAARLACRVLASDGLICAGRRPAGRIVHGVAAPAAPVAGPAPVLLGPHGLPFASAYERPSGSEERYGRCGMHTLRLPGRLLAR
jgi:ABC-type spermidine/putrescine transport system permease subunit II/ABC-type ATPase involved in cell division